MDARRAVRQLPHVAARHGGRLYGRQDRHQHAAGQEPRRSFYTPAGVLADTKTLATLPNDIFIEGLGEVAKSGFIRDPEILHILEDHAAELRAFDGSTFLGSPLETWLPSSLSAR